MTITHKLAALSLGSVLLFSCGDGKDHEGAHDGLDSATVHAKDTTAITVSDTTKFKFDFAIANIPGPASTIQDLKAYGVPYDKSMLVDPNKVHGFAGESQRSFNLGALNIDMAYAMVNNIGVDVLEYSRAVLLLVDRLGLGSTINTMVGRRAEANMNNRDSIFKLIDEIYVKSDDYLRTNKRVYTAANIFAGSWVEAIYLNTAIYKKISDRTMREKARKLLWEQRFHLGNLINLLNDFKSERECADLIKELTEIHREIVAAKEPAELTEEKFASISDKIYNLRTRLTN